MKGKADVPGLACSLGTCWCLRAVQNWYHSSPGHHGRVGPGIVTAGELTPPLARFSTQKYSFHPPLWVMGAQIKWPPKGISAGELPLSLISCMVAWIRER